jgi:MFS transporter, FHS family, L-fucose permease
MHSPATAESQAISPNGLDSSSNRRAMAVLTTLFFLSGFLAALNDILIPHLKPVFDLNYAQVMLIQFSFFSAFLLFATPSAKLIGLVGYQRTMVAGLLTMSMGAMLFLPAANVPSFAFFMCALVILAGGITALQVSGNPYVAVLGPARTASSRLTLTQACNSLGSTIAPTIGGLLLLDASATTPPTSPEALHRYQLEQAAQVKLPYLGIAIALFILALLVARSRLPKLPYESHSNSASFGSVWRYRHVCFGVAAIFLAVGGEVAVGSFLVNYLTQTEIGGLSPKTASVYVSLYWSGSMVGRFLGSAVMRLFPAPKVLGGAAVIVFSLLLTTVYSTGQLAMGSSLAVGLFNSIMFPTIFTLGIANLGPLTGKGSGVLMAAAVGGAVIPVVQGAFADAMGIHPSFIVPAICYAYVAFYGFEGCRPMLFTTRSVNTNVNTVT